MWDWLRPTCCGSGPEGVLDQNMLWSTTTTGGPEPVLHALLPHMRPYSKT
jgi:hypothetical protein